LALCKQGLAIKIGRFFALASWSFTFLLSALAQQPASHQLADRIKSGVIYEVNPRTSSAAGDLGVTILWIMPIHPVGQAKKKGSVGSAYAVQDYYAINPSHGTKDDFKHLVNETTNAT
jgi:hypothetical protein